MIKIKNFLAFGIIICMFLNAGITKLYADDFNDIFTRDNLEKTLIGEYSVADKRGIINNNNKYINYLEDLRINNQEEYLELYTCNNNDIIITEFNCGEVNEGDFSLIKFLKNYDSDGDGINDFYDYEVNTRNALINFVCNENNITNNEYNCNIDELGKFKLKKRQNANTGDNFDQINQNEVGDLTANHNNKAPSEDQNIDGGDTSNINIDGNIEGNIKEKNKALENFGDNNNFFKFSDKGTDGIKGLFLRIARDLRLVVFAIVGLIGLIVVIKLIFGNNTEEEAKKLKMFLIWGSVGIILMQTAYSVYSMLFDKNIGEGLGSTLSQNIVGNFIGLLNLLAGFVFVAIMIYSFFQIVTSNGDEEKTKKGKMIVLQALMGMIVIKASDVLVKNTFNAGCNTGGSALFGSTAICEDITDNANIIYTIINWINSFVGIATVIIIIYAGFLIMTSNGEEEKTKKAKKMILYVAIGLLILLSNYIIVTFFMADGSGVSDISL